MIVYRIHLLRAFGDKHHDLPVSIDLRQPDVVRTSLPIDVVLFEGTLSFNYFNHPFVLGKLLGIGHGTSLAPSLPHEGNFTIQACQV